METLLWAVKAIGGPGSLGFLALGITSGAVACRMFRRSRIPGAWLVTLAGYYLICSLPLVSETLVASLPQVDRIGRLEADCPLDALIVLGGDNYRGRIREATQVIAHCSPRKIVVSEASWLADRLADAGVPRNRLQLDGRSRTTRAQVDMVRTYLEGHPGHHVGLIASRLQMPRIAALVRRLHLSVVLLPSPLDDDSSRRGVRRLVPSISALQNSYDALYEHLALAYYRWRGWIG